MTVLSTGQRLKSSVCATEIMVIKAPSDDLDLSCGGSSMSADGAENGQTVHPDFSEGTTIGKRYVNGSGELEILCVKPGDGSLAVGGTALKLKDAKKLPKTD